MKPEQLAEERYPITDLCINCGADYGLHHADTNQCPKNGREAIWDRKQEWQNTCWISDDNRKNQQAFIAGYNAANEWIAVTPETMPDKNIHGEFVMAWDLVYDDWFKVETEIVVDEESDRYSHWKPIIPPKN